MKVATRLAGIGLALVLLGSLAAPVLAQGTRDDQVARVTQALQNLQDFLNRARDLVKAGDSEKATELFSRAEETAQQASTKLADGKLDEAMDLIRRSRELAEQAVREARMPVMEIGRASCRERV